MYRCDECNVDFNNHQQRANHIRWIHKKVKFSDAGLKNIAIANKKTADKMVKLLDELSKTRRR